METYWVPYQPLSKTLVAKTFLRPQCSFAGRTGTLSFFRSPTTIKQHSSEKTAKVEGKAEDDTMGIPSLFYPLRLLHVKVVLLSFATTFFSPIIFGSFLPFRNLVSKDSFPLFPLSLLSRRGYLLFLVEANCIFTPLLSLFGRHRPEEIQYPSWEHLCPNIPGFPWGIRVGFPRSDFSFDFACLSSQGKPLHHASRGHFHVVLLPSRCAGYPCIGQSRRIFQVPRRSRR